MIIAEPKNAVERNVALTGQVTHYFLKNPQVLDSLPDGFELVILPNDDLEMQAYNLALYDQYRREDKPVVFARLSSQQNGSEREPAVELYAPVAM